MSKSVDRRSLLAGIGASGLGAVLAASALPALADETGASPAWDEECDVLVLGGGGAGSAVAYGAAKEGARVIVLDGQNSLVTTSTALCGGFISFVGSPAQEMAGIEDSVDVFLADVAKYGGGHAVEGVARLFAENCLDYYDLIDELGVVWLNKDEPMQGKEQSVARILQVDPVDHQTKLAEAAMAAGADYRLGTAAEHLVVDADGKVVGAVAADGTSIGASRGVVVATGGFTGSDEMLEECMPGLNSSTVAVLASPGNTGQGHRMVAQLGGVMTGRTTVNCCPGLHPESIAVSLEFEGQRYGAIDVNSLGRRYCNESAYYSYDNTYATVHQPLADNGRALTWQVFSQDVVDIANSTASAYGGITDDVVSHCTVADTLDELAEAIGAPYLVDEVESYNADIEANGGDTRFNRMTLAGEETGSPVQLVTGPFYAWPQYQWLSYTPTCGYEVNEELHPVNQYGEAIEGVYLVGEIMCRSVVGDRYPDGVSTAASGTLGYYLGRKLGA